jgi:hypothetical protein
MISLVRLFRSLKSETLSQIRAKQTKWLMFGMKWNDGYAICQISQ